MDKVYRAEVESFSKITQKRTIEWVGHGADLEALAKLMYIECYTLAPKSAWFPNGEEHQGYANTSFYTFYCGIDPLSLLC